MEKKPGNAAQSPAGQYGMPRQRMTGVSSGISPVGPSRKVKAAVRKAVKNIGLCPGPEPAWLRRFFSSKFSLPQESMFFANSVKELISLITSMFRPGKVLIVGPAPVLYENAAVRSGLAVQYCPGDEASGFSLDSGAVLERLEGADLLFIANPNRITGRLAERDGLSGLLKAAEAKGVLTVLDESLIEFTDDEGFCLDALRSEHLVVIRTTSHFYGLPGLELAFAVSSTATAVRLGQAALGEISPLAAEAARTAYRDKAYRKLSREYARQERRLLERSLARVPGVRLFPSDSNMLLIRLEPGREMADFLAGEGFFIEHGGTVEGLDSSFLRISVMEHDKNLKFTRLLRERLSGSGR